ncbi:hypothetical protein HGRIS_006139 [Hohenbuehelia grisea]|uniref:Secreted protein n=1 Tax=Hohenbuehelia grisea TaxID=104357 RepID=A0ABR3JZ98_9AGAR
MTNPVRHLFRIFRRWLVRPQAFMYFTSLASHERSDLMVASDHSSVPTTLWTRRLIIRNVTALRDAKAVNGSQNAPGEVMQYTEITINSSPASLNLSRSTGRQPRYYDQTPRRGEGSLRTLHCSS